MGAEPIADVVLVDLAAALSHVVQADLDGILLDRGAPGEMVLSRAEVDEMLALEAPRAPGTFTPTQLIRPAAHLDARKISGEQPIPKRR
jgi:hypothetical protein